MKKPTCIMIHHSAVSYTKNRDQFNATNNFHKAVYGFIGSLGFFVGYTYEINAKGLVRQARKDGEPTAAAYQKNLNDGRCIHICLDGNFDQEKPTPEQVYALRDLLKKKCKQYAIPAKNIMFHNDVTKKTCPGGNIDEDFIRSLITK